MFKITKEGTMKENSVSQGQVNTTPFKQTELEQM